MKYTSHFWAHVDFACDFFFFLPSESQRPVWAVDNIKPVVYKTDLFHRRDRSLIQYSEKLGKKKKKGKKMKHWQLQIFIWSSKI
jgi:hypothetical protein